MPQGHDTGINDAQVFLILVRTQLTATSDAHVVDVVGTSVFLSLACSKDIEITSEMSLFSNGERLFLDLLCCADGQPVLLLKL